MKKILNILTIIALFSSNNVFAEKLSYEEKEDLALITCINTIEEKEYDLKCEQYILKLEKEEILHDIKYDVDDLIKAIKLKYGINQKIDKKKAEELFKTLLNSKNTTILEISISEI